MFDAGHWQEYRADRVAATCSTKYAEGGMEFMRNCMQMDALCGYVDMLLSLAGSVTGTSTHSTNSSSSTNPFLGEAKGGLFLFHSHPPLDSKSLVVYVALHVHIAHSTGRLQRLEKIHYNMTDHS